MDRVNTNAWTRDVPWIDRPHADIEAFVRTLDYTPCIDLVEKLSAWRRDGLVILEGAVGHELIDEFLADIAHAREHFHDYNLSIEIKGRQTYTRAVSREEVNDPGVKFNHLHTVSRAAARLSLNKPTMHFLRAVFQAPPVVQQSLTFWCGSQQPVHIDHPFVCRQKRLAYLAASWIALEDVQPDAGPLAYYPGAHKTDVCGFFDWDDGEIIKGKTSTKDGTHFAEYLRRRLTGRQPVTFLPRKGDVLIWHGNLPHTGTPVKRPGATRKSYVTHYTSLPDYPDSWKLPTDEDSRSVQENGGVAFEYPWTSKADRLPSALRAQE